MAEQLQAQDLAQLVETYSEATGVRCQAFDPLGRALALHDVAGEVTGFCAFIGSKCAVQENCRRSYVYGGLQAEKLGDSYIYFCPFGLANWAAPIMEGEQMRYFLAAGPVLLYPADELLIEEITQQEPQSGVDLIQLRHCLQQIEVVTPSRVRHLANLLMCLARDAIARRGEPLEQRRSFHATSARIAETIHSLKNVVGPEDTVSDKVKLHLFEKEQELISALKLGDKQRARELLNEALGLIYFDRASDFEFIKARSIQLMGVLSRAAIEVGADLEIIFGLEYAYLKRISQINAPDALSSWLVKVLDRFIDCTLSLKNVKNRDIMFKALGFIRGNYAKPVTLEEIASEIGLNPAYFSKLFKKEMGIGYVDYLNRVRIEASKELLTRGIPLADIAQSVGFNDQSYYSKVFKRFEGESPGKWRSKAVHAKS